MTKTETMLEACLMNQIVIMRALAELAGKSKQDLHSRAHVTREWLIAHPPKKFKSAGATRKR